MDSRTGVDRRRGRGRPGPGDRAVTPAVGKTLELGIVVLFVGFVTTALLGGVVPGYRAAAGEEVADRTLAAAAQEIERAVPPTADEVTVRRTVDLPTSIAGRNYAVRVDGRSLVLAHPNQRLSGRILLSLPPRVDDVDGEWQSGADTVVAVRGGSDGVTVELKHGGSP